MTRDSLKRAATEKYLDDQLLNTFSRYMNRESRNGRNESLLSIHCYTTHLLTKLFQEDEKFDYTKVARWCRKMRREDQNIFLKDALFFPVNFVHTHCMVFARGVPYRETHRLSRFYECSSPRRFVLCHYTISSKRI
jgi:Ulp1 family protease